MSASWELPPLDDHASSLPGVHPATVPVSYDLVKRSVDALRKEKQRVSLSTVAAKSRELDVEGNGKGISESAILDNQEARAYYQREESA